MFRFKTIKYFVRSIYQHVFKQNEKRLTIFYADNTLEWIGKWILKSANLSLFSLILEHKFDGKKTPLHVRCIIYK